MEIQNFKLIENTLIFNSRDELIKVSLSNVAYFESDSNYCHVVFTTGTMATMLASLSSIEKIINGNRANNEEPRFIRIGKRYIINSQLIFQINIPRKRLVLSDLDSPFVHELSISSDALKNLKKQFIENT